MSKGSDDSDTVSLRERLRRTGRNEPCPCGSGHKYKKCCLPLDEVAVTAANRDIQRTELRGTGPAILAEGPDTARANEIEDCDTENEASAPKDDFTTPDDEEPKLAPEVRAAADRIWEEFNDIDRPSPAQLDTFLNCLLALPPEATDWADLLGTIDDQGHPDLPSVFRRIAAVLPPTKAAGACYFYGDAMEKFVSRGRGDLVPEIASAFRRLDRSSYNADTLKHLVLWALAAGYDAEALKTEEHFLPVMRGDAGLMPYAVPSVCRTIFELRIGLRLPELGETKEDLETVVHDLQQGLGDDIAAGYARSAAQVLRGEMCAMEFRREDFSLSAGSDADEAIEGDGISAVAKRHMELLMHVGHGAWRHRGRSPGAAFRGLGLLVEAGFDEREERGVSRSENLLDCLRPAGMERRIAGAARDVVGTIFPHAHLLIEAHADLLDFAHRHRLIAEADAVKTSRDIAMLRNKLGFTAAFGKKVQT